MKRLFLLIASAIVFFASCGKDGDEGEAGSTFSAMINGTSYNFTLDSAEMVRFPPTSEKVLEITATSTDGTTQIIILLQENPSTGNSMSVKAYPIYFYIEDDPITPVDESKNTDNYFTLGKNGGSGWDYSIYTEKGNVNISSWNEGATTVSGTFQIVLTDYFDDSVTTITNGIFNNIKYTVRIF